MLELAVEPAPAAQHGRDQHEAHHEVPVVGEAADLVLEEHEQRGAEHRSDQRAEAAQDHHHQHLARHRPEQQIGRHEHDVLGCERAGEPGERARDREGRRLVPLHRQPERPHARLVGPDADQRTAEARAQQDCGQGVAQAGERHAEQREAPRGAEIDAQCREVEPGDPRQAIVAAQQRAVEDVDVGHLAKGERRHDEEDAVRAGADRADHPGEQRGRCDPEHEPGSAAPAQQHGRAREGVGADAVERAVAERDHAAEARDQIEADRQDREDRDLGQQFAPEEAGAEAVGHAGGQQEREGHAFERGLAKHVQARAGNSPCGRHTSTAARQA